MLMGALAFPIVVDKRFPDGFRPPFARCIALWGAAGQLAICLVGLAALFLADPTLSDLGGITPFYKFPLLAAGAFVLTFFLTLWGFKSGVDSLEGIRRRRMLRGGR